jgi:tetratricopeptide (TPR) repeat protein
MPSRPPKEGPENMAKAKPAKPAAKSAAKDFKAIDKLLTGEVTRKKTEEVVGLLKKNLAEDPDDTESLTRVARAWIRLLEAETGTVLEEKKEYQAILDEAGKKALDAAKKAHEVDSESADTIGWHLIAYGYNSIAIGIVRAFLAGAATKYIELAQNLVACDAEWHAAAGHRAMGRFYRESPWPKRDLKKAIEQFKLALDFAPKRLENKLHLALAYIDNGQKAEAKPLLQEVLKGKPEATEAHFHSFLVDFAKAKLAAL